jgi:DNA-binding NtrC family response regulator
VEDIPVLARHFLEHSWQRHHAGLGDVPALTDDALELLRACPWRGNVRELHNIVEQLAVRAAPGGRILPDDVALHTDGPPDRGIGSAPVTVFTDPYHVAKEQIVATFEKEYLTRHVARASGNMSRAARLANIDRTTLYRLLERHRLRRSAADDARE